MPSASSFEDSIPLFIAQLEQLGGAERSLLALATWLHEHGRPVHIVTYQDACDFAQYASFPLTIHQLRPFGRFRSKVVGLRAYFRSHPSRDVPLVSGYQPALHSTLATLQPFHCLMHDTPVLFETDGSNDHWKARLRLGLSNWVIARGLERGGRTIVTSEFLRADCRRLFGVEADIARMGGLGSADDFRRRAVTDELRLLSVCRIEANKRIDWILNALAALEHAPQPLSSRVNWRLDLAGKGSLLESMRHRAGELGLSGRVHFLGFVPDDDLATLYDRAHLFLMPAVQGYGIPAIEALQRGIPVLLHRDSGVSDILLRTPWASVLTGGEQELAPKLDAMVHFLAANRHLTAPPPPTLPNESAWAERVARLCGYV